MRASIGHTLMIPLSSVGSASLRPRPRAGFGAVLGSALLGLFGCAYVAPATVPIDTEWAYGSIAPRRDLIVFLPGLGDTPDDFVRHDFVRVLQARHPEADAVLVDAYFNYYRSGSVVTRLYEDVIEPAKERGYERIYVVGISLGGLGALSLAREHPGAVDGLLLLSPYLGEGGLVREIEEAGGLSRWSRGSVGSDGFEKWLRENWAFLKDHSTAPRRGPRVLLGYGTEDRFARALNLLAAELPREQVRTHPGIHDWQAWTPLYVDLIDELIPKKHAAEADGGPCDRAAHAGYARHL